MLTPNPFSWARQRALQAAGPIARRQVPWAGEVPGLPSAPMNFSLGLMNRISSARGAKDCHQGAEVRSGTRAMPLPWQKNLSSQGIMALRPPKGGFINTNADLALDRHSPQVGHDPLKNGLVSHEFGWIDISFGVITRSASWQHVSSNCPWT